MCKTLWDVQKKVQRQVKVGTEVGQRGANMGEQRGAEVQSASCVEAAGQYACEAQS